MLPRVFAVMRWPCSRDRRHLTGVAAARFPRCVGLPAVEWRRLLVGLGLVGLGWVEWMGGWFGFPVMQAEFIVELLAMRGPVEGILVFFGIISLCPTPLLLLKAGVPVALR